MPGACAASTRTATPRARQRAARSVERQNQRTFRRDVVEHGDTRARRDRLRRSVRRAVRHRSADRAPARREPARSVRAPRMRRRSPSRRRCGRSRASRRPARAGTIAARRSRRSSRCPRRRGRRRARRRRTRHPRPHAEAASARPMGTPARPETSRSRTCDGCPFNLVADRLLRRQDPPRRHADGAVIEIRHVRIERPVREHRFSEGCHCLRSFTTKGTKHTKETKGDGT